ncbi:hypothetical protein M3Y97_00319100 [Aphelenchoides bicaudatus]|nr:hypothetical protein M3Y97_00319100 [Aphelenchoides bicaudatus]
MLLPNENGNGHDQDVLNLLDSDQSDVVPNENGNGHDQDVLNLLDSDQSDVVPNEDGNGHDQELAEYVSSSRNGNFLIKDGHTYEFQKEMVNSLRYRCCERRNKNLKCSGSAKVSKDGLYLLSVSGLDDHTHAPNIASIERKKIQSTAKEDVKRNSSTQTRSIYSHAIGLSGSSTAISTTSEKNLTQVIRYAKRKLKAEPANPKSLADFNIPEQLCILNDGQTFLFWDSGQGDSNRIITFASQEDIAFLSERSEWAADGTFSVVPSLFDQLYTIHGLVDQEFRPVVYALMSSRTKNQYIRLFTQLRDAGCIPTSITIDFEQAALCAAQHVFPDISIRGCFFHFSQCLWRKIQHFGLARAYGTDEEFSDSMCMFAALAFLPKDKIISTFELIQDKVTFDHDVEDFMDYFEKTFIGKRAGAKGTRKKPLFPIDIWCCNIQLKNGSPRTTNSVEGWHNAFNGSVGSKHPSIWTLLEKLKEEQIIQKARHLQSNSGGATKSQKKKYRDHTIRLQDLLKKLERKNITELEFIKQCAKNIKY